ncbi:hypothetical protein CS0771_10040 [Catellatospora sp. IY07-71]|nr:hypothetical protein CS0771_10040 [Catellatospora sp. IY07-71]
MAGVDAATTVPRMDSPPTREAVTNDATPLRVRTVDPPRMKIPQTQWKESLPRRLRSTLSSSPTVRNGLFASTDGPSGPNAPVPTSNMTHVTPLTCGDACRLHRRGIESHL